MGLGNYDISRLDPYIRRAEQMAGRPITLGMPDHQFLDFWFNQGLRARQQYNEYLDQQKKRKQLEDMQKQLAEAGLDQSEIDKITNNILQGSDKITDQHLQQMQKQVVDARTRLAAAGKDPNAPLDDRNALEKFLNLHPGDNWFWDTLNILGRPGQAVLNAIDKKMELDKKDGTANQKPGILESILDASPAGALFNAILHPDKTKQIVQAAIDGLAGRKETSGDQLIGKYTGMKPGWTRAALGFGIDVLTDPLSYIGVGVERNIVKHGAEEAARKGLLPKLLEKANQTKVGQAIDNLIGSEGRNFDIHGNYNPILKQIEQDAKASRAYTRERILQMLADATKSAGGIDAGEGVGKVLEMPNVSYRLGKLNDQIATKSKRIQDLQDMLAKAEKNGGAYMGRTSKDIMDEIDRLQKEVDTIQFSNEYQNLDKATKSLEQLTKGQSEVTPLVPGETATEMGLKAVPNINEASFSPAIQRKIELDTEIAKRMQQIQQLSKLDRSVNLTGRGAQAVDKAKIQDQITQLENEINQIRNSPEYRRLMFYESKYRQFYKDPALREAAQKVMQANEEIMNRAKEAGLNLDRVVGYMSHVMSDEATKALSDEELKQFFDKLDQVKNSRKPLERNLYGTVDEINQLAKADPVIGKKLEGANLLEPNAFVASAKGLNRLLNFIDFEHFKQQVFSNPNLAIKVEPGVVKPKNAVKVNINDFVLGTEKSGDAARLGAKVAEGTGGDYYVSKGVYNALLNFKRLASEEDTFHKAAGAMQKVLTAFKKMALFTPTYHINNALGSMTLQFLRGMRPDEILAHNLNAAKIMATARNAINKGGLTDPSVLSEAEKKALQIYDEFMKQGLKSTGMHSEDFARAGEDTIRKELEYKALDALGKLKNNLKPQNWFEASRRAADTTDELFRLGTYLWGKANGLSAKEARNLALETHFDYSTLTRMERDIGRLVFPFYTFTKKSIPFMLKYGVLNPKAMLTLEKLQNAGFNANGINKQEAPDYLRNAFAIPITKDFIFNPSMPMKTLMDLVEHPVDTAAQLSNPLFKLLYQTAQNKDDLGNPISRYEVTGAENKPLSIAQALGIKDAKINAYLDHALQTLLPIYSRAEKAGKDVVDAGGQPTLKALADLVGVTNVKKIDEKKWLDSKWSEYAKRYQETIDRLARENGEQLPKISDLRKLGIVGQGQASENQVKEAQNIADVAKKHNLSQDDITLLLKLKRKIERSTPQEAAQWKQYLLEKGLPEDLVSLITKDYLNLPTDSVLVP